MKVIIAGGRNFNNYELLLEAIHESGFSIDSVVSGGAPGADQLGERFARDLGVPLHRFPAEWSKYGNAAGPIRNRQMAKFGDALIACWDGQSRGTRNMIEEAEAQGLSIYIKLYKDNINDQ